MWIGLSLNLISTAQQFSALSMSQVFSYRILNVRVEDQPEMRHDVHKAKKKNKVETQWDARGSLRSETKTDGPEGFDYKYRELFAITNKQELLQRWSLIQSNTRH